MAHTLTRSLRERMVRAAMAYEAEPDGPAKLVIDPATGLISRLTPTEFALVLYVFAFQPQE